MKKFGIAFITVGFYLALFAFNMDVVVGKTYNIGLLDERQNIIFLSGIIFLAGIILCGFGFVAKEESKNIKLFAICCILLPAMLLMVIRGGIDIKQSQRMKAEKESQFDKFIDNQDGTITHQANNLVWLKCSYGQLWNGITCLGEAKKITWDEAIKLKSDLNGKTNWRLPTANELIQLVDCSDKKYDADGNCINISSVNRPTISKTYFPNTPSESFWSSSSSSSSTINNSGGAWVVLFSYGNLGYDNKDGSNYVRLVRNAQ